MKVAVNLVELVFMSLDGRGTADLSKDGHSASSQYTEVKLTC